MDVLSRPARALLLPLVTLILGPVSLRGAQAVRDPPPSVGPLLIGREPRMLEPQPLRAPHAASDSAPRPRRGNWTWPAASLLVPGSGQLLARQERGVVYLALEAWLIARAASLAQRGSRERESYRELAFRVARREYAERRLDGPFSYYEAMERFVESGVYDADPGPGFVPESDATTYNGSIWLLARQTYFTDPDSLPQPGTARYAAALSFYQSRAVSAAFRWSWRDARLEQDLFRQAIRASDQAFRVATNFLGALVANHLASAVDALITSRLRTRAPVPRFEIQPEEVLVALWQLRF